MSKGLWLRSSCKLQVLLVIISAVVGVSTIDVEVGHHYSKLVRRSISENRPTSATIATGGAAVVDLAADSQRSFANHWREISVGDVHAITVDDGTIYATGVDKLKALDGGIFMQALSTLSPYSNWTLIGYGSMSSIAVHNSPSGKIMYGVGSNNSWLYKQNLATMASNNVWMVASVFSLSSVAISGDLVYGVSRDHPGQLYKANVNLMHEYSGLGKATSGGWETVAAASDVKSLTIASGSIFAIFDNNAIYQKLLGVDKDPESDWTQQDRGDMVSIAVVGDTMYGVSKDHKVYREPLTINKRWTKAAKGPMRSLAIGTLEDTIYGLAQDGRVHKQDLVKLSPDRSWEPVTAGGDWTSMTIQGDMIYAVGHDKKVYKQTLSLMSDKSEWKQASACCVKQITAADGVIYGIGEDNRVYHQADHSMTLDSKWILASKGNVVSITVRGDTIYGIDPDGFTFEQRRSHMTNATEWAASFFEDALYPSKKYLSIMAHNDIMYACGIDMVVYTKRIKSDATYPPNLVPRGNTHRQALQWNLTDLSGTSRRLTPSSPASLPIRKAAAKAPHAIVTPIVHHTEAHARRNEPMVYRGRTVATTTEKASIVGVHDRFVDRFQDQQRADAKGRDSVTFGKIENTAWHNTHMNGVIVHFLILLLTFATLS